MAEISINEYVRTNCGEIEKVVLDYGNRYMNGNGNMTFYEEIVKHSKNIIDLIEGGDIVTEIKVRQPERIGVIKINNIEMLDRFRNGDIIYSIVTKEQFKNIEYRLED